MNDAFELLLATSDAFKARMNQFSEQIACFSLYYFILNCVCVKVLILARSFFSLLHLTLLNSCDAKTGLLKTSN